VPVKCIHENLRLGFRHASLCCLHWYNASVSVPIAKDCRLEPRPCRGTNSQALSHQSRISREGVGRKRERERERERELQSQRKRGGGREEDRQTDRQINNTKYD